MEDADTKPTKAPPLPRIPTVIADSMPSAPTSLAPTEPKPPAFHVAPPRFPSLGDVGVEKAQAAADSLPPVAPPAVPSDAAAPDVVPMIDDPAGLPPAPSIDDVAVPPVQDAVVPELAQTNIDDAPPAPPQMVPDAVLTEVPRKLPPDVAPLSDQLPPEPTVQAGDAGVAAEEAPTSPAPAPLEPESRLDQADDTEIAKDVEATGVTEGAGSMQPVGISPHNKSIGRELEQDILDAIERDQVPAGTGERRAMEAASKEWTQSDQEHFIHLIRSGQGVLPAPELYEDRLLAATDRYIPVTGTAEDPALAVSASVATSSGIAARVAALNKEIEHKEGPNVRAPAGPQPDDAVVEKSKGNRTERTGVAAGAGIAAGAVVGAGVVSSAASKVVKGASEPPAIDSTVAEGAPAQVNFAQSAPADPMEEPAAAVNKSSAPSDDVHGVAAVTRSAATGTRDDQKEIRPRSRTAPSTLGAKPGIFPPPLATVPLTIYRGPGSEPIVEIENEQETPDAEFAARHEVMVRSNSTTAHVNITGDYGLKGGHSKGVNDAGFFDHNTLVTAGVDGKVCIWDLEERYVKGSFVPYNGKAVTMLSPLPEEDGSPSRSLITLSEDRWMNIWHLSGTRAVLLRSEQIHHSENDLLMSVPVLTPQMKAHAAAAAAAAAVTTSEVVPESAPAPPVDPTAAQGPDGEQADAPTNREDGAVPEPAGDSKAEEPAPESPAKEDDVNEPVSPSGSERKRFSFVGDLFGGRRRSSAQRAGKKAVAS